MSFRWFPSSFNPTYGLGGELFWRISRWSPWWPSWILEHNNFSNYESLCCSNASYQVLAQSNLQFGKRCRLKNFKMAADGRHGGILGHWNGMILAIVNLYVTPMHPFKFRLNLTYGLGEDVIWRISRWPPWQPSWILEWNDFSNSESLCHCDTSHQVSSTVWEEMSFKEFKDCRHGSHLGYRNGTILSILNLHVTTMPPTKFQLNPSYGSGGDVENVKS